MYSLPRHPYNTRAKYEVIQAPSTYQSYFLADKQLPSTSHILDHKTDHTSNKPTQITIDEVQGKIKNLEDDDFEILLTLAAEVGNALLAENGKLKQDLNNLKLKNVQLSQQIIDLNYATDTSESSTLSPKTTPLLLELTKMKVRQDHIEHLFNSFQEQLNDSYYKKADRGKNNFSVSLQVAKAQAITHHNDKKETKGSYNHSTGTVHKNPNHYWNFIYNGRETAKLRSTNCTPTLDIQPPTGRNSQTPTNKLNPTLDIQPPMGRNSQTPTNKLNPTLDIQPPMGRNSQTPTNKLNPTLDIQSTNGEKQPNSDQQTEPYTRH
ncbi:hypothetical protein J6590_106517 [Homalodisca vitripennis]|nr:hypothetical protein J6590_106517 [Homalodisca vitripennis]